MMLAKSVPLQLELKNAQHVLLGLGSFEKRFSSVEAIWKRENLNTLFGKKPAVTKLVDRQINVWNGNRS